VFYGQSVGVAQWRQSEICFLATGKSGIGHLRRVATIAGRLRSLAPSRGIHLITNARPDGLSSEDLRAFDSIHVLDRARMATDMPVSGPKVLVLDTITVPGVEKLDVPLALLLREAPDAELHRFRLQGGREWDLKAHRTASSLRAKKGGPTTNAGV
jgi:hypothetical protein